MVESDYESWKIRIERYIRGKPKLIWRSIQNGPTPHPQITVTEGQGEDAVQVTRDKRDEEFTEIENNKELADIQATNILSQGLPRHVFNILNQTRTGKEIWDNVELLMKGSGKSLQQQKEELFDEYERFRAIGNESIHDYFVRFHKLINDMKITQLNIPTHQMNTKFVNNLPPYWAKYVTNVKNNKDISATTYVELYTYLKSYEPHAMKTLKKQEQSTSIFPPTNNQLKTSSNSRSHATVPDGQIITETVQRRASGNVGNTGHVSRQCKEKKRVKDSQYFKDKMLMEAKEKGTVLDAEAEAFLADVECTSPYDQPLAITTTNMFEVSHEDAYDSDVDEGPHAAAAFIANLSSISGTNGATTSHVNEVHTDANQIFNNVNHLLTHEMHQEEHLDSDVESDIDDNTILYHQYQLDSEVQDVPTEVSSAPPGEISMITFLDDLRTQLDGHLKVNQERCLVNDSLRAELARCKQEMKDICSIVLASDIVVPPSSNCLCEELRSNCDREHSKVVELEAETLKKQQMLNESEKRCAFIEKNHVNLQVKFQKYKECLQNQRVCDNSNSTASNEIFEINKLKDQLQGKDDTIRNLQTQINITRMLNVGSTVGSFDKQALETELTQLKDALTSVRIQIDGYKAENVNLKRRYEELSKSNAHSRSTFTAKINVLTAENAKLKTELISKISSGSIASEKPKVLASGMYTNSSKYNPPPKRANWVKPTPLPKKKQVTFQEPPRTSNRPTQKPPVQQNKKPNVPVNLSTRTEHATESHKPMPNSHTRNHHILPSKSVNAKKAADHNRELNVVDHNQFVIRSLKSVNTKTPQAKHNVNHTKKVWKATRNHNVNTTKTAWRPTRKVVGSVKPLFVGRTVADSITERLKRSTTYVLRQIDFSLLSRYGGLKAFELENLSRRFFIELYLITGASSLLNGNQITIFEDIRKLKFTEAFAPLKSKFSSNAKVKIFRRRKSTKAFMITASMSMSDQSSANGELKKRSQVIQENPGLR
ncbi:hypothetical protein Tco_0925690 [Tanacetum coccineum]|uniref:Integrase, catalytic region, zinc finger, CCHC-type, peptidase aspartic, catalytic n=1 Tax=Tanacetum coccineum TaxID=301880 RepID=A0ABQ5D7K9_9ASTR